MRQIEFRGQEIGSKKWVEGFYFEDEYSNSYMIYGSKTWQVYPETVGQYTGLKDKNGVKIFEGDILKSWHNDMIGKCVFMNGAFGWYCNDEFDSLSSYRYFGEQFEVIGNIHE